MTIGNLVRPLVMRFLHSIITLWLVTVLIFALTDLMPGDFATATATRDTTREQIESLRYDLGLFASAPQRYMEWLGGALSGDFGSSWFMRKPIATIVSQRLWHSTWLVFWAMLFALPVALTLALVSVAYRNKAFDKVASTSSIAAMSIPDFMIAYGLMGFLAVYLRAVPVHTIYVFDLPLAERLWASTLPILSLAAVTITPIFRVARAALINTLNSAYVEMAELKGLSRARILIRHALPNSVAPIVNSVVIAVANLFAGLVIVETIFSYPGFGKLIMLGVDVRDVPLVQACALVAAALYIGLNFFADVVSVLANPRLLYPTDETRFGFLDAARGTKLIASLPRPRRLAAGVICAVAGAGAAYWYINQPERIEIVRVLPPTNEIRDQLTAPVLLGMKPEEPAFLHYDYFAPVGPVQAAKHNLEGRIHISVITARQRRANQNDMIWNASFPAFGFDVVTHKGALLPIQNDRFIRADDGDSLVLLSEGRIWSEAADGDWSRASFPFSITPLSGNVPSYGVATFLFNGRSVSQLRVQIADETAHWAQYDLWGQGAMTFSPRAVAGAPDAKAAFENRKASAIEIRPWSELAERHWRSIEHFDGSGNLHNVLVSGLMVDDVFYLRPCRTRAGPHPHCRQMRFGVFSVTKSLGAAVSMLWLAKKYGPGVFDERLVDYISIPASHDGWKEVTFRDALDMATGIGNITPYKVDQYVEVDFSAIAGRVWRAKSMREKLDAMAEFKSYPWGPGEVTRYRTSDTTALSAAMDAFVKKREGPGADFWAMLTREVFEPIGIERLPVRRTLEPDGRSGTPLLGAGLYVTIEDALKISRLLQNHGAHKGQQLLHRALTARAVSTETERGFKTGWKYRQGGEAHYDMSFWLTPHKRSVFGCSVRVPVMSGFGGNYVLLMPNGTIGLRFADGHDDDPHTWDSYDIRSVSDHVRPFC